MVGLWKTEEYLWTSGEEENGSDCVPKGLARKITGPFGTSHRELAYTVDSEEPNRMVIQPKEEQ
jgi:hypothetical protein